MEEWKEEHDEADDKMMMSLNLNPRSVYVYIKRTRHEIVSWYLEHNDADGKKRDELLTEDTN